MGQRLRSIFLQQTTRTGSFVTVCFLNMLLNFRWSIPAWLLLAAYLLFGFPPLWVFFIALALWPLAAVVMTAIVWLLRRLACMPVVNTTRSGGTVVHVNEDTPNRNPYSATREKEEAVRLGYDRSREVEGKDYYAEYMQSEEYKAEHGQPQPPEEPAGIAVPPQEQDDGGLTDLDGRRWVTVYGAGAAPQEPEEKSVFE